MKGGVRLINISEHTRKNVIEPVFWGFITAIISLPFYLALAFPQIGMSLGGHKIDVGMSYVFIIPAIAAFLASAVLGEREMVSGLVLVISGAIFLSAFMIFLLMLPRTLGIVYWIDFYYIGIGKKFIISIIIFFPSLLVGAMIGRLFGDAYISETSRSERKRLNEEMREWKKTLERAIMESDRGNPDKNREMAEKKVENGEIPVDARED